MSIIDWFDVLGMPMLSVELLLALSIHLGMSKDYNEIHPHVRLNLVDNFAAGVYLNSNSKASFYVSRTFATGPIKHEVGVVTGYFNDYPFFPMYRMMYDVNDSVKVFGAPIAHFHDDKGTEHGAVLGVEFKF